MAEQVQSGPQQSRARRFLGAGKRTLDGEDRSERIKTGRKGTPFRAFSPTIKPEFPRNILEVQECRPNYLHFARSLLACRQPLPKSGYVRVARHPPRTLNYQRTRR